MLSSTLRGTIVTFAMPFALSAAVGNEDNITTWRPKPFLADLKTGTAIGVGEFLLLTARHEAIGSADTSEKTIAAPGPALSSASAAAAATERGPVSMDWIAGSLAQVMELRQTPVEDLPNEAAIKISAVANAAKIILDLQDSQAPLPQVVARGDGGLQLVWYTPTRDLEIEVRANGELEIVEFDGRRNQRVKYSPEKAVDALLRIRDVFTVVSEPA